MPLDQLLGPLGVAIGAILLVGVLGRLHLEEDKRTRERLLDAERRLDSALASTKQHADVADRTVDLAERVVGDLTRQEEADRKYRSYASRAKQRQADNDE